jgi:hypothetical protein
LVDEVRAAFEPITASGRLTNVTQTKATVQTVAAFMQELPDEKATCLTALARKVKHFALSLLAQLSALLAPLSWLEAHLAPYRTGLDEETERLILWGWKHREALALSAGEGFPEALQPIVRLFFTALSLFHRTSSPSACIAGYARIS